ncbi:MAG: tRNA (adenosine(37)-N6)-dimethylallyltransferase MiaA [Bacteroidales bacterium]|nr:tRNA (adenosine(37)-N6)-dimethylallyltransferase MiaA [Bacteroidales bacterium]
MTISHKKPTLIIVLGPTASGKTSIAIRLAKHYQTEIISADSRQFYREIPIGTAAPTAEQMEEVIHHFVGQRSILEDYNVSQFEKEVLGFLSEKFTKKNIMVMEGGSGLYIDAVCKGIDDLPDPDPALREELNTLFESKGITALQELLAQLDPEYYVQVDRNNPKRLLRALEVCKQTGKKYSNLRLNQPLERDFNIIKIGLDVPREQLIRQINHRTDEMMKHGLLEEAKTMLPHRKLNAMNTVGYKELFDYFDGKWTLDDAIEKIKINTRRYAKRQMTWFKKDKEIQWFSPSEPDKIIEFADTLISR